MAVGGNIVDSTVVIGLTPGQVHALVEKIMGDRSADLAEIEQLAARLEVHEEAVRTFLQILGERHVSVRELPDKLEEIANRHRSLLERIESSRPTGMDADDILKEARNALENGDYDRAEALLASAEERALSNVDRLLVRAAAIRAERGELEATRLNYRAAMAHFAKAAETLPDSEALLRADYLTELGVAAWFVWDLSSARTAFERTLELREAHIEGDSPVVAETLDYLGGIHVVMERYPEAEVLLDRAIAMRESTLGEFDPKVAESLIRLSNLYEYTDRPREAESALIRAIAIAERNYGPEHADVANHKSILASFYMRSRRYAEAEALFNEVIAMEERVLGKDSPETAITLNNLASLYQLTGRLEEAERYYERTIAVDEKNFGQGHWEVAIDLNNLGMLYWMMGRHLEAEAMLERAVPVLARHFGTHHPTVRTAMRNLAALSRDIQNGVTTPLAPGG